MTMQSLQIEEIAIFDAIDVPQILNHAERVSSITDFTKRSF